MRPKILSIAPYAAAVGNSIATAQTPAAGGVQSLALTSTPFTNDIPRQVAIASAGNDSARVFVVEGTDRKGNFRSEAVAGPNAGTVQTVKPFKTVTAVLVDANTAGAITVGTTTIVDTDWLPMDAMMNPFLVGLMLDIPAGNAGENVTVQITMSRLSWGADSNPYSPFQDIVPNKFGRIFPALLSGSHDTLVNKNAAGSFNGNIVVPVTAIRLRNTTVFTGATIRLGVAQTGIMA
jgi:hypothetical protein